MHGEYKKILIAEAGGIGDMVMSTPVLNVLRKRFPRSIITLLTVPRSAKALTSKHYVDKIICFNQESFSKSLSSAAYDQILSNLKLLWTLRKERFDMMIDLEAIETWKASLLRYIFFKSIGARNKVGRNSNGRGFFLDVKVHENILETTHEIDRKLLIAKALGAETNNPKQNFLVSSEDRGSIDSWLQDSNVANDQVIVAMHPGSFAPIKRWKREGFIEIGKRLYERYNAQIILTGDSNDKVVYEMKKELINAKPMVAVGFPLGRLGALLERTHLFISNDTGPCHIADAINTPLVVIFGPDDHHRYGPYNTKSKSRIVTGMKISCSPCLKYECKTHECMESITSDMVWEEVESLMKEINK